MTFFSGHKESGPLPESLSLLVCWAIGGAAVIYGLMQVTPGPEAQRFIGFVGGGALIAFLGWWAFADLAFGPIGAERRTQETQQERDTRWTRDTVLIFCYVGIVGIVLFAIRSVVPAGPVESMFRVLGVGVLIACGSLLSGTLLGFLFGIPRAQASPDAPAATAGGPPGSSGAVAAAKKSPRAFQVNTNLEQISDWLTKIIVGLGLINLARIPGDLRDLAAFFSQGFGTIDGRESVTLTLIVAFTVCGFLLGYLLTRLFLTGAFTRAESAAEELRTIIDQAGTGSGGLGGAPLPPPPGSGPPGSGAVTAGTGAPPPRRSDTIDPTEIDAAFRVKQIAGDVGRREIRDQVLALAEQYDATRAGMPFSGSRTQVLDGIVARMRVLSAAAKWMLLQLANGKSPGERLAAIAFLQMQPDPTHIPWLEQRFRREQPFLMYHAALALKRAVDPFQREHWDALKRAIDTGKELARGDEATQRILTDAETLLGPKPQN